MKQYEILNAGYQEENSRFSHGAGCNLYDENGIEYIDMAMGAGSLILGHTPQKTLEALHKQSRQGTIFLQNNSVIQQLSQTVSERIPKHLTKHVYCNSGSEATQRAVRIARAATNKSVIASFQGGWHGMNEWTLSENSDRFVDNKSLSSIGIPNSALKETLLLPYNNEDTWKALQQHANVIAAVIIEPVQGSNPQKNIQPFLKKLEKMCKTLNIILIFDEMITGFRLHLGGGACYFDIKPDIATYGKILGGGLPIGMVAISNDIYEKTFLDPNKRMLTGGTFSANPLSAATGNATLDKLNKQSYQELNRLGALFRELANEQLNYYKIPFKAEGIGSISRIYFTNQPIKNRKERDQLEINNGLQAKFRQHLWRNKVIWPNNGIICNALCQTDELIEHVITRVINAAKELSIN